MLSDNAMMLFFLRYKELNQISKIPNSSSINKLAYFEASLLMMKQSRLCEKFSKIIDFSKLFYYEEDQKVD